MISFKDWCREQKELNEGFIRSGSIATFAARSAAAGKQAEKTYKRGLVALERGGRSDDPQAQLDRIRAALKSLLDGQILLSQQIGSHIALDTVGHIASRRKTTR